MLLYTASQVTVNTKFKFEVTMEVTERNKQTNSKILASFHCLNPQEPAYENR